MSEQEAKVGRMFKADFEKSGIHLESRKRDDFVNLNNQILDLGYTFTTDRSHPAGEIKVTNPDEDLKGIPSPWKEYAQSMKGGDGLWIPLDPGLCQIILTHAESERLRKDVFLALNTASEKQVDILEQLLRTRGKLARLLGKSSYSELFLADKMAQKPGNIAFVNYIHVTLTKLLSDHVLSFLEQQSHINRPIAQAAVEQLRRLKANETNNASCTLNMWDRDYFLRRWNQAEFPRTSSSSLFASYISVGSVFEGLSLLFQRLYGIRLEPVTASNSEVWHPDVRKLHVIHETDGLIGTVYCDLFQRPTGQGSKFDNPAHFTVRCSRRVDNDYDEGPGFFPVDTMQRNEKTFQLPIVVLVCGFRRPSALVGPTTLSLSNLETLFHEMGHAMHCKESFSSVARMAFLHSF
jgi:intermediate peptidase